MALERLLIHLAVSSRAGSPSRDCEVRGGCAKTGEAGCGCNEGCRVCVSIFMELEVLPFGEGEEEDILDKWRPEEAVLPRSSLKRV